MDGTLGVLLQGHEEMTRDVQQFMTALDAVVNRLASQLLDTQGTPMAQEEHSMKERLETPVEREEGYFVLEQLEEPMIIKEEEEVVEDLGDAEPPWEAKIIENPSKKIEFDVEEESAQPPKQFLNEDLERMKQELSSLGDEDHASNHLGGESFEFEEPSPNEIESNVEVDFSQPPIYDLSDGEELDEIDEQRIGSEEVYEEVEINKEEHKGVKLASTLEIPLPKPPPSILSFKWVNSLYSSFIIPLEYGLLETDGQLRHICGFKSKKEMASGWKHYSRLIMVACSKLNCTVWYRARLFGSRRMFGHFIENSKVMPPKWNNDNQLEDGCGNKIWDPGIHEDQFWEPMVCEELHQGLKILKLTNGAYWRFKHWWMFKDSFKHKPP